ncbi:MAG: hypothetical protein ACEPO8_07240 [Rhodothermaceae bacterium]
MKNKLLFTFLSAFIFFGGLTFGQLEDLKISGHWFLNFKAGKKKTEDINKFDITRGYLNIEKSLGNGFSARLTPDITLDEEGSDAGNVELRLKYAYLKYKFDDFAFFTNPYFEVGVVHRPFFGFEQKINPYRVQGKMFMDRFKVIGTTDYGISFFALLGGKLDKKYQKEVSKAYPGKYGSFSIGIYNGGGYHAIEENKNKTIETRLTVRPLWSVLPNLQLTYFGAFGKGNTAEMPDLAVHAGVLTFEHQKFTLIGQYYTGEGNSAGTAIINSNTSHDQKGYSLFAEIKVLPKRLAIFGRYDNFTKEKSKDEEHKAIVFGAAYKLNKGVKLVADFDASKKDNAAYDDNSMFKVSLEVKF